MVYEIMHALVLQSHGIEHTHGRFGHTRIRVSFPMMERGTLHDDASDFLQVDEILELQSISECTRCGHDRVRHVQFTDVYA